jgi:hypothetical protein
VNVHVHFPQDHKKICVYVATESRAISFSFEVGAMVVAETRQGDDDSHSHPQLEPVLAIVRQTRDLILRFMPNVSDL